MNTETSETKSVFQSLVGKGGTATNMFAMLQSQIMREADQYVGEVAQATDDFSAKVGTTEARDAALQWKLNEATVAYVNAAGENPALNAVDMVVLATLSRMVMEDYWVGEKFGERAQEMLETHRRLESNAWTYVEGVLSQHQLDELHNLIHEWRRNNPDQRYVAAARFAEFVEIGDNATAQQQRQKPDSILSLLYINPLAGLDPTTEAIEQTRSLAQRAMYYAQRAPMLLGWQVELTTYQLAAQPEVRQVLSDLNGVAKTAEGLPKLVDEQRKAAIDQLLAGVANERSNIVASIASGDKQLRELLPQMRETFDAAGQMGTSLNGAIKSLDAFVHYVTPPQTNAAAQPSDTNSPPFNVLDYGKAASQIGAAANDLNALLQTANQTAPQVTRDLESVVHRAFWLGLVLVVVLLVGALLVALAYRRLTRKSD